MTSSRRHPRVKIPWKTPRKWRDLEEQIFLEPNKNVQLQKFEKLRRAPFEKKSERFFDRNILGYTKYQSKKVHFLVHLRILAGFWYMAGFKQ